MSYYKFTPDDLFTNTIEANPDVKFYIQSGSIYLNDENYVSGTHSNNVKGVPRGFISLYEYNIDRPADQRIHPFLTKDGFKNTFKTLTKIDFNTQFNYDGETITSTYNLSSSITRYRITSVADTEYKRLRSLTNSINHYRYLSPLYDFDTYFSGSEVNMICIPSIFYGSSIKKGSVNLKYFISGTLAAQASDNRLNGDLVQVSGSSTGYTVGTILYNEGIILLTSSAQLDSTSIAYEQTTTSSWCRFGYGANDGEYDAARGDKTSPSASFAIEFQGTNHVQTMTMLARAPYNELNHSNNPTYMNSRKRDQIFEATTSRQFVESPKTIKNIVHSPYNDVEPDFKKETYISKIALYDEEKNLIGFAKLATPVRKTEDREFLFKLKLDI
tara:strand:- start:212 stop:1369 length:1158 start_codon:yes stop_codon:yes gene_type:complete